MLSVHDLTVSYGDRQILTSVSFQINEGDRVGLIGPNGAGKSTLLEVIAGDLVPHAGTVSFVPGASVGYLRQGFADLEGSQTRDLVAGVSRQFAHVIAAERQLDAATLALSAVSGDDTAALANYDDALAAFEAHGGYSMRDRLDRWFATFGLNELTLDAPIAHLSGGEKTRAALATLLAERPSLLILDEPTNHLDAEAHRWLEEFLESYRGAVLIVSHDRAFLDQAVSTILELDDTSHSVTTYAGGYSEYLASKRAEGQARATTYARQQDEIAKIERDIGGIASRARATERGTVHDYWRGRAKKVARTAKVRQRKLQRLLQSTDRVEKPVAGWGIAPDFGELTGSGQDVVHVDDVTVALGGRTILRKVDLHVRAGDRIALTGPNGSGKTTLVRLLAGDILPDSGHMRLGAGVKVGWYAQEQETTDLTRTVLEQTRAAAPLSETEARTYLHRYLFDESTVAQPAAALSYGERARLKLALLVLQGANLLLLDEPFNHLDLSSRERFEEALSNFTGTTIAVLHDRFAINRFASRILELRDGQMTEQPPVNLAADQGDTRFTESG